ncbi:Modifier of mdg4 [Operophtera brumata]|uniref:Modifier of mdg4 n=1 Tax=Operophtera brumata TaxID=104452 RepID=A0A0L7K2S3_OPEBR|nr:Modifier of mdg4 [Operophtera brumata]
MNSDRLYYCSKKKTGCKAKVRMDEGYIIYASETHTHEPPNYQCTSKGEYDNRTKRLLRCSSKSSMKCTARLKYKDGKVEVVNGVHNHDPPVFIKTKDGNVALFYNRNK